MRTKDGIEIDLVLEFRGERWAIEVKLTSRPAPEDLDRLTRAARLIRATRIVLVSRLPGRHGSADRVLADVSSFLRLLRSQ